MKDDNKGLVSAKVLLRTPGSLIYMLLSPRPSLTPAPQDSVRSMRITLKYHLHSIVEW